jgi:hypothetical protein
MMGDVNWKMIWGCDLGLFFLMLADVTWNLGCFLVILEEANCTISRDLMMYVNDGLDL